MTAVFLTFGLLALCALAVWNGARWANKAGRAEVEAERAQETVDAVKEQKAIVDSIDALPAGDARGELRKWSRD